MKTLNKLRLKWNFVIYKSTVNITLNDKSLVDFHLRSGTRGTCIFKVIVKVSSYYTKEKKKSFSLGKSSKHVLFKDNMIFYIESLVGYAKNKNKNKVPELISDFRNVQDKTLFFKG